MEEIWRDAVGYEGLYRVSDQGRVMSMSYRHTGKPRILKQILSRDYLTIHRKNRGGRISVHIMVARAFIPNPGNLPCVNHINEIKTDNRACNLEWCDYKYNNTYGDRLHKMINTRKSRKEKTHFGYISQYSINKEFIAKYKSTVAASKATGIERSSINRCALNQQKTAGGYIWIYE